MDARYWCVCLSDLEFSVNGLNSCSIISFRNSNVGHYWDTDIHKARDENLIQGRVQNLRKKAAFLKAQDFV